MNVSRVPAEVLGLLEASRHILVLGHVRPDGDTSASAMALGRGLRQLGKSAVACLVDGVPDRVAFLAEAPGVVRDPRPEGPYDLAVVVDSASYARIGVDLRSEKLAGKILNIDHHGTNERFGDLDWVDTRYPATAQMIHDLLLSMGVEFDGPLAEALFTGIATDTGYLRYEATTPETFRVMAGLVEAGADHTRLHRLLFDETPLAHQRLQGLALSRLVAESDGRLVWTQLECREIFDLGVEGGAASLAISPLTRIREASLVACFEERPNGDVIVEFRSRGRLAVDQLARSLGGGGHLRASGCTVAGPLARARDLVLPRLRALLAEEEADTADAA